MRKLLVIIGCLAAIAVRASGDDKYSIANIPEALLKKANVIKRAETIRYEISGKNTAYETIRVAYTILNEQGDDWGSYTEGYDKLRSIESFDGTLYDAMGKKIKSLKKSDIRDMSGTDDALADDYRVKSHSFYYKVYPYTVEYEIGIKYKGTMFMPVWMPQERPVMSVEQSSLTIVTPSDNPVHFKMFNYKGQPVTSDEKNNKVYTWEAKSIEGVESEYASPAWYQLTTSVFLASEKFSLEDYEGSNATWKDFGKFVYDLKKDRDALPDDVKLKVHSLTDGLPVKEKISKLYEYMQQNTRYVSIQLGIGGWQPFDAKFVATKRYGDCKALSNYMYSLLKEAGVRSVYTVITAGENKSDYMMADLPHSQFNHVILFVPDGKDTTWLECTSQTMSPGYLSGFTSNRYAVAVDENGGTLVHTPSYGAEDNLQMRVIDATIDADGNLSGTIKTRYRAEQQDRLHYITTGMSKDKLMEFLKEDIELPTYDIRNFAYKEERSALPVIDETLNLVADNYATVSGRRFFVVPNIISRTHRKLKAEDNRKCELVLDFPFKDVDSTAITIPAGYTLESMPADIKLDTKFGIYKASIKLDGNHIVYYRTMEQFSGRFPASDYAELAKFYDAIYKADRNKIVLVKNETPQKAF